jgi:hypothetical protein
MRNARIATAVALVAGTVGFGQTASAAGTFSGTVVGSDNAPIAGATVMLVDEEVPVAPIIVSTDESGAFAVSDVPNGDWKVLASSPGYAATFAGAPTYGAATEYIVTDGSSANVSITLQRASATVEGLVTDASGDPVAGAFVNVSVPGPYIGDADAEHFSRSLETDANGYFVAAGMSPGSADVFVEAPDASGLVSEFWENVWDQGTPTVVALREGATVSLNEIELDAGATLTGVVRGADGAPAAGVLVVASGINPVDAVTAADGSYSLFPVAPGRRNVTAISPDADVPQTDVTVEVSAGATVSADITIEDGDEPPVVVDTTPPTITCPAAPSFLLHDGAAALTVAVADSGSGVASPTVSVAVPTDALGAKSVTVEAADLAGNKASAGCGYSVGVDLVEIAFPSQKPVVKAKAGSEVPVVWKVVDANGKGVRKADHLVSITTEAAACPTEKGKKKGHDEFDLDHPKAKIKPRRMFGGYWIASVATPKQKGCVNVVVTVVGDQMSQVIKLK